MTDNIHTLNARIVTPENEAKAAFLAEVARQFDHFVEHEGREPDALVFVLSRSDGGTMPGWLMRGAAENFVGPMIAYATSALNAGLRPD